MKKVIFIALSTILIVVVACKKTFLDVQAPSSVDQDFVFSSPSETQKVLAGVYEIWRGCNNGLFYDIDVVGSDAETHPEAYSAQTRHIPEGLYASEISTDYASSLGGWNSWYSVVNRANLIMESIAAKKEYQDDVAGGQPSDWTQLYGEAAVFRAFSYHQLIRYFGDVPYITKYDPLHPDSLKLTSRDVVYDGEIENLKKVEPLMYRLGEGGVNAERFSRTFAQALLAKIALFAGGYGLRRTDFNYGGVSFTQKGTEMWNAKYVRVTDYQKYYQIAKTYLQKVIDNPGSAYLITTDSRGAGYNNPFQLNFQYNMDLQVSPESLFEIGETRGQFSERPYAFGRPSGGGGSNAYPCKSYGQSRLRPSFYYGDFDPSDIRRDVTATVTANSGSCSEKIIDFAPGSREKGGLTLNKWDESRQAEPWIQSQRQSGINWPMMRMAEVYLMLAEVNAELGDEGAAKTNFTKVRSRAFSSADQAAKVTNYIAGLAGDALKTAILNEYMFEFSGEGILRDLYIRTGTFTNRIVAMRNIMKAMVNGLKTAGYYTFPNGNTISNYIYVKALNVSTLGMSKMLTTQCEVGPADPTYPVRFPGWRGNYDKWTAQGYTNTSGNRNLAIQGLFNYIDPAGAEATTLVSQGYVKTPWGANIVANESQYTTDIFKGYTDAYYASGVPPRYLFPISSETILKSEGGIKNGYGF